MRRLPLFTLAVLVIMFVVADSGQAQTYSVLYNFGSAGGDPSQPLAAGIVAQGRDGNLYGTAVNGGANNQGAVFKITPKGTLNVVFSFNATALGPFSPFSGLTLGTDGDFYGTTQGGGSSDDGTIFKITPAGSLTVLHSFTGLADGYTPKSPPVEGTDGNFYGTAIRGANSACGNGCGTVYKITPSGNFTTLYPFDFTHGATPWGPLVQGTDGNFYGTTAAGGTGSGGVVFKITPAGKLTVLHSFCSHPACADGQLPSSPLVQGSDGNFYGTTGQGGANGYGEVFKITAGGTLTVLHSMNGTSDGYNPFEGNAGLVQATDGNFYGANSFGGSLGHGTFFKITPKGAFSVLHNFDGTDGVNPYVTPFQHTNGVIYGDTQLGGTGNVSPCVAGTSAASCGVFYSWTAGLPASVKLLPTSGKVGSQIGILGQGFSSSSVVKFNGVKATTVKLMGTTFLLATVPAGTLDGYVTVTTGTTTLKSSQQFLVHDSWGSGAPMPTARAGGAIGVINGKVYVVSGETNSAIVNNNEIYNPATNKWTTGAPIPTPRYAGASAVVNGILYVMGGIIDASETPQNIVEAYNPATNTWSTKSPMPTATDSMNAVVENNLIYVVGGYSNGARSALVQRYDPATDTWTAETSLMVAKSDAVLGLLGSSIVAAGGLENTGNPSGDNEAYAAGSNTWKELKADPTPRNAGCGAAVSGQLYVTGGSTAGMSGNATAVTESYNLSANSWTTLSPAPQAVNIALPAVVNGQLFCFGGTSSGVLFQGNIYNNVQIYQP
jgi:uncharacterized repeat protein (TIGR03803 family)